MLVIRNARVRTPPLRAVPERAVQWGHGIRAGGNEPPKPRIATGTEFDDTSRIRHRLLLSWTVVELASEQGRVSPAWRVEQSLFRVALREGL